MMTSQTEAKSAVEVYLVESGKGRARVSHEPCALALLPADTPLPNVGDIVLLPKTLTHEEQAYVGLGEVTPYCVAERELLYSRNPGEEHALMDAKPARYVKAWIHVRRLSPAEYEKAPGRA
jgi:hypothetical protein